MDSTRSFQIWSQLYGSALSYYISELAKDGSGPVVLVSKDSASAQLLRNEIDFYLSKSASIVLPEWETLPYDVFSPHQDIISERLKTLSSIKSLSVNDVFIVPVNVMLQRLAPVEYIQSRVIAYTLGQELDIEQFRQGLENSGYDHVSQVMGHGEYAIRGSIIDLYPAGSDSPFRIDLFDNQIESMRIFDPSTQKSNEKISTIEILPAREFPTSEEDIKKFRERYRKEIEGDPLSSVIYNDVSQGVMPAGIEYYQPLFFDCMSSIFDYLPNTIKLLLPRDFSDYADVFLQSVDQRYEQRRHDIERPVLAPGKLFLSDTELQSAIKNYKGIWYQNNKLENNANFPVLLPVDLQKTSDVRKNIEDKLIDYIQNSEEKILIVAETKGRREIILDLLKVSKVYPHKFDSWSEFIKSNANLGIVVSDITEGLRLLSPDISVLTEHQIFGNRVSQRRRRKTYKGLKAEAIIQNLTDVNVGAPVVHIDHGVGRYLGLQYLSGSDYETEFLTLEYAGGDKLYVPVTSLHLISRYTGSDSETAPLHKLGTDQWQKAKSRAAKQASDAAAELLDIYARRAASKGNAYHVNHDEYMSFVQTFQFEETEDQEKAINDVLGDLEKGQPMDRVVCGDVGFGKTEVAMRAAFVVATNTRQVAMLVPTTLLAQQHYQNFLDRFADLPINIACLSRFASQKETTQILKGLAEGKIDIVIGTHKLLQGSIKFNNLGLIIIDEEHRFGVKHKEKFKSLRAEVDMLTLTATPIPRTLNMSLSGIRDLSIISTPPVARHSIKTFITEWNDTTIIESCYRELARGGQIYFLHNEVKTIENKARQLRELLPEARVEIAHGQMSEKQLESVMADFYHQRFNVLVCTTIIESGIDVPSANTIIINRADKLGLAQLHQIRGRVGRSHHRAYAYLIAPPESVMTADAKKRLDAIESLEDLGVGFTLATHDMEIRGAGELLGENQSGQIAEVGFSLYSELLEKAVSSLRDGKVPDPDLPLNSGVEIDLGFPALIPADYIGDIHLRLVLYKRIAAAKTLAEIDDLKVEFIDRFGLLPDQVKNLFTISDLKLMIESVGVQTVKCNEHELAVNFNEKPSIEPLNLIELIQQQPEYYIFNGKDTLRIKKSLDTIDLRYNELVEVFTRLTKKKVA